MGLCASAWGERPRSAPAAALRLAMAMPVRPKRRRLGVFMALFSITSFSICAEMVAVPLAAAAEASGGASAVVLDAGDVVVVLGRAVAPVGVVGLVVVVVEADVV